MIKIEDYKGFEIFYDEDSDKFITTMELNNVVKEPKRASLKALKQEINTFVKLNLDFKPFKILFDKYGDQKRVKFVSAIRSDGSFVVSDSDKDSYKSYMRPIELRGACVYDESYIKTLADFDLKIEKLREERKSLEKELREKLVPIDLSRYEQ